jgi:pilus assembly protein CpaE
MPASDPAHSANLWRFLSICPENQLRQELGALLQASAATAPSNDLSEYPDQRLLGQMLAAHQPNVCFVDVSAQADTALNLIRLINQVDPGIGIVALLSGNNPELILRCLRQGANEFLLHPLTAEQLDAALAKLVKTLPKDRLGPKQMGKIYAVLPAKGACGASTVAANLAFQCRRLGAKRILLVDLDPLAGTVSFMLKVKSAYSFMDVLHRAEGLDTDLWKAMVVQRDGVDILLSPEVITEDVNDLRDITPIIEYARANYDAVVLDAGAVYGEWSLSQARFADEILLVTTNELPALQAAQRALNYLESNRVPRFRIKLIVNRYAREIGLSKEVIATALNTEVFATIPSDFDAVQKGLMEGKGVPASTPVGKAFQQMGDQLIGPSASGGGGKKSGTSTLSGLFSLFSR